MRLWHDAQVGFLRCASSCWRSDAADRRRPPRRGSARRAAVGRRRAEDVLEDPLAAQHRRGARRVGRHGEHAGLRQHAAALRAGEIDAAELGPGDARDAVVPRQPLVDEGVRAVEEVEDAAVLADDVLEEQLGLAAHRDAQVVVERRELVPVARRAIRARGTAATGRRTPRQRRAPSGPAACGAPAPRARRLAQLPLVRRAHQLVVRHARPQEVRQPRRQLVLADRMRPARRRAAAPIALDAEQEVGRDQDRLERDRQAFVERVAASCARPRTARRDASISAGVTGRRNARRASDDDDPRRARRQMLRRARGRRRRRARGSPPTVPSPDRRDRQSRRS